MTMSDSSTLNGYEALEEKLGRLSKKPGVRASIVLDRTSGAILKTSGELSALRTAKARDAATSASFSNEAPAAEASESQGVEDFAAMIWNFVKTSGNLVQEVDSEVALPILDANRILGLMSEQDEMRLLRLRTKKQEIVIVPDAKYVLTVVHDTPSA
ncbi:Dynein light chain-related protein [Metarhizium robertsii ARSEF 23]|uniref:Dynein light chain-related protein n=1 Tax=Metarhizium robertsii (strain ARSEF 23 / ATCC MYA-3075) TaxID=655844 RepID=E9F539_METRA|nr:Dynein light chain-related protein [Metarhizium robertsii ARSEF 23]EFY97092.1 Dynein light chain-related protein [Metarhizium robertsii ARSEF 23]